MDPTTLFAEKDRSDYGSPKVNRIWTFNTVLGRRISIRMSSLAQIGLLSHYADLKREKNVWNCVTKQHEPNIISCFFDVVERNPFCDSNILGVHPGRLANRSDADGIKFGIWLEPLFPRE